MSLPLLHPPSRIVQRLLVAMGWAADPDLLPLGAWPAWVGGEPSSPDEVLTVYDTTPKSDGRAGPGGEEWLRRGIQVRVRANTQADAFAKAEALRVQLNEQVYQAGVVYGGASYLVWALTNITVMDLGKNVPGTKLNVYTMNMMTFIDRTA